MRGFTWGRGPITYVPVAQGAAGTTVIAAISAGNKHKIVGVFLTIDAAGTVKFTDGGGDLCGAMSLAQSGGFVLTPSGIPWLETAVASALNLVSAAGKVSGVVAIRTEP